LAPETPSTPALQLVNVVAGYHGNQVLHGVSLEVGRGEIVLILGPNGTGKSTLLAVAAGLVKARTGRVLVNGEEVTGLAAHRRARKGVALVPEGRRIFGKQSVQDNLLLGSLASGDKAKRDGDFKWVYELFPVLERKRGKPAATLSGGEQQMLAIAQAVMSRPAILMLDEPSAGLAPILAKQVQERVRLLKDQGISVLMVEQMAGAISLADRVYVMRNGEVVSQGNADEFGTRELGSQYLGTRA